MVVTKINKIEILWFCFVILCGYIKLCEKIVTMAVPLDMLMHPELLSNEQLKSVIQERHLRIPDLQNLDRDDLLELFHNFCVPYGQRKYRDKGRGKVLNKTRQSSPEPNTRFHTSNGYTICGSENSRMLHSDTYKRLKPPPDTLTQHMKKIKIATLAVPINDNILKRKIAFHSDMPATDSPPQKKDRKPITWP